MKNGRIFELFELKMWVDTCIQDDGVNFIVIFYGSLDELSLLRELILAFFWICKIPNKGINLRFSFAHT